MKRLIAIERVSAMGKRKEQDESTRTLTEQRKNYHKAARIHNAKIVHVIKTLDQSGFDVLPKITPEIVTWLERGDADGVVMGYSSRLARNWMMGGAFLQTMIDHDADVIDGEDPEGPDYRSDTGRTIWGMKMVVNEIPSLDAKRRGKNLADSLHTECIPTKRSYGYRRNADAAGVKTVPDKPAKWVVPDDIFDENGDIIGGTASVVRRIFTLREDGKSWVEIAETLNADGIPSPSSKDDDVHYWGPSTVAAIIANKAYIGIYKLGKREREDAWAPLVTTTQWRKVQSTTKVARTGKNKAGLAGGLLECGTCGMPMSVTGSNLTRHSYGCRKLSAGTRCERPVYISRDATDDAVERVIVDVLESGDGLELFASMRELDAAKVKAATAKAARKGFAKYASVLEDDDFTEQYEAKKEAERIAKEHYEDLLSRAGEVEDFPRDATAWRAFPPERQRWVARSLIERIRVLPPVSRGARTPIEDRLDITFVGGIKMTSTGWLAA